ncbi:MAG: ABC transporter ATP-binding protein/permease, partial [Deltaproteobacteria bacterium]|nr:ABC transporter ATP-binding protein/permease [Deltaproteobacteria bacterium]
LMSDDEGEVRLLGERPEDPEVRRRVGFVPESAELPPQASPRALVRRWALLRGLPVAETMAQGLVTLERLGMAGLLDRAAGKLSKGEKQRTLLALAMLGQPELLVLDEPTDGLDPLGRARMREVIRGECERGTTVFLNSHLLAETERICTRVGILHQGQLVREERLTGPRGAGEPATTAIVLASSLRPEQLERARVQPVPEGATPLRDLLPAGATVLVPHQDLGELNDAIDRLRAEGAQLVEVRRVRQDLEAALAEVAGVTPAAIEALPVPAASTIPTGLAPAPPLRLRPLRALQATLRVTVEIALDLASRRVGWFALGAAALGAIGIIKGMQTEALQGAAAAARHFGTSSEFTDAQRVAAYLGGLSAQILYWSTLFGGALLAAIFMPTLFDPKRTILLLSQPITRTDYSFGVLSATLSLALATSLFFHLFVFVGLRFVLDIAVPWWFLAAPLVWIVAFTAVCTVQLLSTWLVRSALFTGALGVVMLWATAILGSGSGPDIPRSKLGWGILYAILPRAVDLMHQAGKLGEGARVHASAFVPTAALIVVWLLVLRVVAQRSER